MAVAVSQYHARVCERDVHAHTHTHTCTESRALVDKCRLSREGGCIRKEDSTVMQLYLLCLHGVRQQIQLEKKKKKKKSKDLFLGPSSVRAYSVC